MIIGITCLIISLFYLVLTSFIYFNKRRIKNIENRIYKFMIIFAYINIFNELLCILTVSNSSVPLFITTIVNRLFIINLGLWVLLLTYYLLTITFGEKKKFRIIMLLIFIVTTFLYIGLPIHFYYDGTKTYSYGSSVDLEALVIGVQLFVWIFILIFKRKSLQLRKMIPIVLFIIAIFVNLFISQQYRGLNILTASEVFITIMMYFTIENPDVAMIEQLNIAKDQAEKANRAKSDFLSSMSHEIRTPLNAIVGFSESLKEEDLSQEAKEEVNDIIEASNALLETVNGILDISKIEANKIEIINGNYEFKKLFNELVSLSKARLGESKPIDFRYHMAEDIPDVLYGDSTRIRQVVLNFLTNAIKYTSEGYINFDVSCIKKDRICRLIFKVEDTGMGIKQESINRLFTKFDRLDNENSTIEGTGLGLAITKKLVDLMHGKIVVQSVYGKGSQFMVILNQKIIEETMTVQEEIQEEKEEEIHDLSSKKILIVDDNALNLKVAARLLKQYNLQVEEVDSGFKCLDLINSGNKYDLILMDDMMPKMSGTETFDKLKETEGFDMPVVILTANAISGMKEKYLAQGFNDYLAKPIEKPELARIVKKFLDK